MFDRILGSGYQIKSIKYFTAIVSGKFDPQKPIRQKTYIRALKKYIPEISVYLGHFLSHEKLYPLAYPIDRRLFNRSIKYVNVIKTEEKGSDVNLAVHLLNDAWLDNYDCAVVVSNDSDLVESFNIVRNDLKKRIGLVIPWKYEHSVSKDLLNNSDFIRKIRKGLLKVSQLPDPIPGTNITKPSVW